MFAVIRTGGKQYRVASDEVIKVERITGAAGDSVLFEDVLLVGDGDTTQVGAPGVAGASVAGQVVGEERGRKVIAFKKRRRTNSRRKRGHRQIYTVVRITEILTEGRKPSAEPVERAPRAAKPKPAEAEEAAAPKAAPSRRRTAATAKPAAEKKPRARAKTAD